MVLITAVQTDDISKGVNSSGSADGKDPVWLVARFGLVIVIVVVVVT